MRFAWLIVLSLFPWYLSAQQPDTITGPKMDVQTPPEYPGGETALLDYLKGRLNPPPADLCSGQSGEAVLTFTIEEDGSVSTVQIIKSLCPAFDSLGIRILEGMPRWTPGSSNGNPVRVRFTLPMHYRTDAIPAIIPSWTNWRFGAGLGLSAGITGNVGRLGQHVGPVMGAVDLNTRFGSERLALEIDLQTLFSQVRKPFEAQGQWENGRPVMLFNVGYGLRQRIWRKDRRDLAIQGGMALYMLVASSGQKPDLVDLRLEKTAPWLGATYSWRIRERKQPDTTVTRTHWFLQVKWLPLFSPQPVRGSFLMLAVGLDFISMSKRAADR